MLESGQLAAGPEVAALEEEAARSLGRRWAVATSSGQAALHLALLALEIGAEDRVAIPSYVCASVLNAVRHVGAREALADCAEGSFNLDPRSPTLEGARAIIVPHLLGFPAPLGPVLAAARGRGAAVIEDCAMAIGAEVDGRPAGASGTLAIVSLYATKMATCGQGGLLLGDDHRLLARARDLTDYDNRPDYRVRHNFQLTDLQAALARRQWSALGSFVDARRRLAARYDRGIDFERAARLGGKAGPPGDGAPGRPCYFRYPVDVGSAEALGRIRERLAAEGIDSKPPVHRPLHRYLGIPDQEFPNASHMQDGLLSIPIYPSLTDAEADRVISALNQALERSR